MLNAADWTTRLNELATEANIPGAALGIWSDGQEILAAHGVLNAATQVPVTTDSVFQVGSITKIWTATMIMQLVDEGLLSLDTTVSEVLPGARLDDGGRHVLGRLQVNVQQMELLDSGMAVGRIVGSRRETHEQTDAVVLGIRRQHFVAEAGRGFLPVWFTGGLRRWQYRRVPSLRCDPLCKAAPQGVWRP